MSDFKWLEGGRISCEPPKNPLKITGTRLGAIMGVNKWSTPFEAWCEITRTYRKPFEDTIYTIAGKSIEPKQAMFMKRSYGMTNLITPTDIFGENYFKKTFGDFFRGVPIFGGMWDYILVDGNNHPKAVLEMKTTKRVEDWEDDIPEYYALQASLYAYLLGVDQVYMVCSFLEDKDYEKPEDFVPSVGNTIVRDFKVSERYPDFETEYYGRAKEWWGAYVETGISPEYDEKKDAEILKELRKMQIKPEDDIEPLIQEGEEIQAELDRVADEIKTLEKRMKQIKDQVKAVAMERFRDDDKEVVVNGKSYDWKLSRSDKVSIDEDAMEADGILEKYQKVAPSYRFTVYRKKEKKEKKEKK